MYCVLTAIVTIYSHTHCVLTAIVKVFSHKYCVLTAMYTVYSHTVKTQQNILCDDRDTNYKISRITVNVVTFLSAISAIVL